LTPEDQSDRITPQKELEKFDMPEAGTQASRTQGRNPLHRVVPFGWRVFVRRRLRDWQDFQSKERIARQHGNPADYPSLISEKSSPLSRDAGSLATKTAEKTRNLELAAARLNHIVILPGEILSFNRTVGPSTRHLGYLPALEFRDGETVTAVGGGLCQLANLIVLLGIEAGMEIVERHRHSLDLFPDADRTAPFGCGATVFYNYVDLRLRNTLDIPLLLETAVKPPVCWAAIRSSSPMPFQCRMIETDHEFVKVSGVVRRRNRLWREYDDGSSQRRELLCHNDCRVVYPAEHLVTREEP
jgi:vancomycin resistance protein VanW